MVFLFKLELGYPSLDEETTLLEQHRGDSAGQSAALDTVLSFDLSFDFQIILDGIEGIRFCRLTERDVVRHALVQKIVRAYEERQFPRGRGEGGDERMKTGFEKMIDEASRLPRV